MNMQPTHLDPPAPAAIAEFLTRHPNFFNDFPMLLAELNIPHPHGTHAVSMSERQLIAMRDKVRMLESKLAELIQFGEENDGISEKLHALTLALLTAHAAGHAGRAGDSSARRLCGAAPCAAGLESRQPTPCPT
jgi:uncharacterized protein